MGAQRRKMVVVGRGRSALLALYHHDPDRPRRRAARPSFDAARASRDQGDRDLKGDEGLWRRRRAARPHAYPFSRRARAEGCARARPRARLRDRPGAARAGAHPSLHARDRPGRAGARGDVPARQRAIGIRAEAGAARRQSRHHRRSADEHRDGAPALPQSSLGDGHPRGARRGAAHLADQGDCAQGRARGHRSGGAIARRGRGQPGFPARPHVDPRPHAAPRRRTRRGPSAGDRQGRDEALHQRGGGAVSGAFPEDTRALDGWASAHIEGWRGPSSAKKFAAGQSNPTYLIDAASGRYVLRRKPPGKLLKMAHMIEREFRVLKALEGVGYPAPRALALCEDEGVIGTAFYLMAFIDGRVLWNPALPELEREDRRPIYDAMNEGLAKLHTIDVAAAGLADYGKPGSYYARQYQRWTDQYRASETAKLEDMERLIAWLADRVPTDDGRIALVHGDWRIDNMIFDASSPRLLAVLDWELSTLGHPFADLAYQCMQWRLPAGRYRGLAGVDRAANGIPTEAEYVAAYCRRMGLKDIPDWTFLIAFSFFRSIAIHQGVYKRSLDGNASNPELARQLGASVPMVAHIAIEAVEGENDRSA